MSVSSVIVFQGRVCNVNFASAVGSKSDKRLVSYKPKFKFFSSLYPVGATLRDKGQNLQTLEYENQAYTLDLDTGMIESCSMSVYLLSKAEYLSARATELASAEVTV